MNSRDKSKQALTMRCCVPFCKNISDNVSTSEGDGKGISFHDFPSEVHLRAAWLRALGKQVRHLPDTSVVCSQHFLHNDICETENGLMKICPGAIPATVQVCMICLDTDSKLFLMSKHKLEEAYEKLTGFPLHDLGNLNQTVCRQCAQRLINFSRFRDKSFRARALMMDLVDKHELITRQHIKMINRTKHQLKSDMVLTTLGPDHCDLHILEHQSEDRQTELEETLHTGVVKAEGSDDSMSVDGDMDLTLGDDNNINDNDYVQDLLKCESITFQCTLCLEEFDNEHAQHNMSMHLQNCEGDGECDTSQVCKAHTAVSSSSSHSSLITENKQADPSPSARAVHTSVASLSSRLATVNKYIVPANEETDAIRKIKHLIESDNGELHTSKADTNCKSITSIYRLPDCVVKLYDIFKNPKQGVPIQDETFVKAPTIRCSDRLNVRTATKDKIYCPAVSQSNPKARRCHLVEHMRTHTGEKSFTCKICNYKFTQRCNLVSHVRTHTGEKPFTCKICNSRFTQNNNFVRHMRTHAGEKPYCCKICDYKCAEKSYLGSHMRTHTGEKPYACKICEYKGVNKRVLLTHTRTHTGENLFTCKICNSKFTCNYSLVRHMKTHTCEKPFACTICNSKFACNSYLVRHMKTHTGEKPYFCTICDYKSANKTNLGTHMRTHTGEKSFACKICNCKFRQKSNLVPHMRTHTGEKPFTCKICNDKFTQKSHLVTHMRIHTGEKPFTCKICNYKCITKSSLVSHMRTHTGEKPFACKICNRKFTWNSLVRHMRTHTGEKPYCCKICEYKCTAKKYLDVHMRTHAGIKPKTGV